MMRGLSKNVGNHGWLTTKKFKNKTPKNISPKIEILTKIKVIGNLICGIIFSKTLITGKQYFYICPDVPVPVNIIRVFFQFQTSQKKVSKPTKIYFTNLNSLTLKTICYRNTGKNLSDFTNFPANVSLSGVRKKICTAPILDAQELHS